MQKLCRYEVNLEVTKAGGFFGWKIKGAKFSGTIYALGTKEEFECNKGKFKVYGSIDKSSIESVQPINIDDYVEFDGSFEMEKENDKGSVVIKAKGNIDDELALDIEIEPNTMMVGKIIAEGKAKKLDEEILE